ncbi:hypothetical protein ACE3MQ_19920 [Paenibacillus lentus]|uniref:hypothetical protein n=1 Tax=Paenibacillus lentus TaxID=1338368 RepID=UPI003664E1ED
MNEAELLLSPHSDHMDMEQEGAAHAALSSKFEWFDRLGCVEAIAQELADNGGKYEKALRSVRLSNYAYRISKMPVKQKTQLKRDVVSRAKDIVHARESAEVGDVVRVPKLIPNPLMGGINVKAVNWLKVLLSANTACLGLINIPLRG